MRHAITSQVMNLYFDDDIAKRALVTRLRAAGHQVVGIRPANRVGNEARRPEGATAPTAWRIDLRSLRHSRGDRVA